MATSSEQWEAWLAEATTVEWMADLVTLWAREMFGGPERVLPAIRHLRREVDELEHAACVGDDDALAEELADVTILAIATAGHANLHFVSALRRKLRQNFRRRWAPPDHEGVIEHVRDYCCSRP